MSKYDAMVNNTEGINLTLSDKWKRNLVKRTHKTNDEEFFCPSEEFLKTKNEFLIEGHYWIIYQNNRSSDGIGLNGLLLKEKLDRSGIYNIVEICDIPYLMSEDFFGLFSRFAVIRELQNVLMSYPLEKYYGN
jgi:hypothetical protein